MAKNKKVTITFKSKAEAVRMFNTAESMMDYCDNGTPNMNNLRSLVDSLETAINKVK